MRRFFSVGARAALRKLNDGQLDLLAMDAKMPADAIRQGFFFFKNKLFIVKEGLQCYSASGSG